MDFEYPTNKKLYLVIEITRLLYNYNCTYDEADKILSMTTGEIKQQRENKEYDTVSDYLHGNKTGDVSNEIIDPLNHVEWF